MDDDVEMNFPPMNTIGINLSMWLSSHGAGDAWCEQRPRVGGTCGALCAPGVGRHPHNMERYGGERGSIPTQRLHAGQPSRHPSTKQSQAAGMHDGRMYSLISHLVARWLSNLVTSSYLFVKKNIFWVNIDMAVNTPMYVCDD